MCVGFSICSSFELIQNCDGLRTPIRLRFAQLGARTRFLDRLFEKYPHIVRFYGKHAERTSCTAPEKSVRIREESAYQGTSIEAWARRTTQCPQHCRSGRR